MTDIPAVGEMAPIFGNSVAYLRGVVVAVTFSGSESNDRHCRLGAVVGLLWATSIGSHL